MAGVIYKITNPNDKIYIGCTIDFKRRLSEYRRLSINGQVKIYNSLSKYGFDWLVNKFKNKFGFNTKGLDVPTAVRSYDIVDSDTDQETLGGNKLIKEQ